MIREIVLSQRKHPCIIINAVSGTEIRASRKTPEGKKTHIITRRHPSPLLHQPGDILINLGRSGHNLIHRRLLPRPRPLDIAQRLLQTPQLHLDLLLGLLRIPHRHLLELLDRRQLLVDVVGDGLEGLEVGLDLVDDGLVLEQGAVVSEVDALGRLGEGLHLAPGVVVALFEGRERAGGVAAEAQLRS